VRVVNALLKMPNLAVSQPVNPSNNHIQHHFSGERPLNRVKRFNSAGSVLVLSFFM